MGLERKDAWWSGVVTDDEAVVEGVAPNVTSAPPSESILMTDRKLCLRGVTRGTVTTESSGGDQMAG